MPHPYQSSLQLLSPADTRPNNEANIWFRDGLRMIQSAPFLWAGVGLTSLGISFAALLLSGLLGAISPLLSLIPLVFSQLFVQAGMLMTCASLAAKHKTDLNTFFLVLPRLKSRGFLQLGLFIISLELVLTVLQSLLFPEPLFWIENEQLQMAAAEKIYQATAFIVSSQMLILFCTWAILPLLIDFPEQNFMRLLRLQFEGMARNLSPLLIFSLLCMVAMCSIFFLLLTIAKFLPILGFLLIMAALLWGWPLLNAWTFSAVRHIFTNW